MFEKLIEDLCQKEDLVDVGPLGIATQSSVSRWSRENDAQRAVEGQSHKDFAFHTDKEDGLSWWKIELKDSSFISYILINNRKSLPFNEIAKDIVVYGYTNENIEVLIYKGNNVFGCLPESLPLILSVYNMISIKSIKIVLTKKSEYLHLSNIHILTRNNLQENLGNFIFYSTRTDGLGERLKSLLNTMILAKKLNGIFYFSWREFLGANDDHSAAKSKLMFSSNFVERHVIDHEKVNKLNLVLAKSIRNFDNKDYDNIKSYDGVLVNQQYLSDQTPNINFQKLQICYKEAFESIEFSDAMMVAKKHAEKIKLNKPSVAIHLRMGDITYGEYRFMNRFYQKVIPIYILNSLVKKFQKDGYQIIIFGQDSNFCRSFCIDNNCIFTGDLFTNEYNASQLALFDIVLMSRCNVIVSGASGFSRLANWIGDSSTHYFTKYFSSMELKQAFLESVSIDGILQEKYTNPLLKSFSIAHYMDGFKDDLNQIEKIDLLKECISIDTENAFYKLQLACLYYDNNDFDSADSILLEEVIKNQSKNEKGIEWLTKRLYPDNTTAITIYLPTIERAVDKGSVVAAIILLMHNYHFHKKVEKSYFEDILNKSSMECVGTKLLFNKLNTFV